MKHFAYPLLAGFLLVLSAFAALPSTEWKIAEGYVIRFTSEEPSGVFTQFSGRLSFDPEHPETGTFDVAVPAASISTGNGMKNKHARSDEWLDAEKYPQITFVSKRFAKTEKGYAVTGTLGLHGVQKEITIPFTFENRVFSGDFTVDRTEFGIGKTTGMSAKVSKQLSIRFEVPVVAGQ